MKKFNNVMEKLAKSSNNPEYKFLLKDEDILNYFNSIVNDRKSILLPRYNLEVVCDEEAKTYTEVINYNSKTNTFIFNKGLFYMKYFFYKDDFSQYEYNLKILEFINKIIAQIELMYMISDNYTYKNEPIFYTYLIYESIKGTNYLTEHYRKMRSLQLTSEVLEFAHKYFKLDFLKKLDYDSKCNNEVINSCGLNQNDYSIDSNYIFNAYLDYNIMNNKDLFAINKETIIKIFDIDTAEKFEYALAHINNSINFNNVLNCILLGKPTKEPKELLKIATKTSLFKYAKQENENNVKEFIESIQKK